MSALLQVLAAAAIIAVLIGLRLFAEDRAARSRARGAVRGQAGCHRGGCFNKCDEDRSISRAGRGADNA